MKFFLTLFISLLFSVTIFAQEGIPTDYLSVEFHKSRREAFRRQMPKNSVAVIFANPERNRSNDVDYVYHQDPNFYYLTGYKEPNAVLVIFSDNQTNPEGTTYNEILYVRKRDPEREQWTGRRLGVEGAKSQLGFEIAFNGSEFMNSGINYAKFDRVLFEKFKNDYRDNVKYNDDLYDLIESFKAQLQIKEYVIENKVTSDTDVKREVILKSRKVEVDNNLLSQIMAGLRQIKTPEEMVLLNRAIRISTMAQREAMKAMHIGMSETEIQGIHEFVYKKYGSEYEGYPSIIGAGNNGCVLHYVENNKTKVDNDLVLMDVGAEYHGYTADVTRTIPANGKFSPEQKVIYDLVYEAQEAGIRAAVVGNNTSTTHEVARDVIYDGLISLGIAKNDLDAKQYFPHGTSHHIGLDVHDANLKGPFEPNMVITVEPGIYIPEGSPCDKKWWGIAVRIEDDVLITEDGPVLLSFEAPRKSEEIEALMKEPSVLEGFKLPKLD